eukprot:CAMPEP_0171327724 /NCGR_PEP_ID=MMETSP0878-20121228/204_1 /TAXON_ID=67004 /ORGANISM="Thalassiosira weissflogii, Strain CCMP1336" /LENGTH=774 /DNA_ID=CAMNT_0011827521 /DNA_START=215 /DNA_END=2539 /DNA_ORIENTATION=-
MANHEFSPRTIMPNNGVSSNPSDTPPPPTYSENLLFQRAFQFQPRRGNEPLDLRRISAVDIPKLIKSVDIELLQSFLENITFAEVSEEDFDLYSNECFVKLFTIAQLTLEYLLDVQDTLSVNLNSLAKKYAAKKRETDMLAKNLARQDAVVATLRDEIHYSKEVVRRYETRRSTDPGVSPGLATLVMQDQERIVNEENVTRADPSSYPSQERRKCSNQRNDFSPHVSKSSASDGAIRLHVVISSFGKYIELNVMDSVTIQNLKEMIADAIVDGLDECTLLESLTLTYLGKDMEDLTRTVKECGLGNNDAIVARNDLLPVPDSSDTIQPIKVDILEKLEELTSVATKAQNNVVDATRVLQDQARSKQAEKDCFVAEVEKQLHTLAHILREEVQRGVKNALKLDSAVNNHSIETDLHSKCCDEGDEETKSSTKEPDSSGDDDHSFGASKKINCSIPLKPDLEMLNTTGLTSVSDRYYNVANMSDEKGEDDSLGSLGTVSHKADRVPNAGRGKSGKLNTGLRIETDDAWFNPDSNESPFLPPNEIEVTPHDDAPEAIGTGKDGTNDDCFGHDEEPFGSNEMSAFKMPESYSLPLKSGNKESSKRFSFEDDKGTPILKIGYLDRGEKLENLDLSFEKDPMKVGNNSIKPTVTPFNEVVNEGEEFRFSEFEYSENEDDNAGLVYNFNEDNDEDCKPAGVGPSITPGEMTSDDSDMQSVSIEVPHSDHLANITSHGGEDQIKSKRAKKERKGSLFRISISKVLPKRGFLKRKKSKKLYEL